MENRLNRVKSETVHISYVLRELGANATRDIFFRVAESSKQDFASVFSEFCAYVSETCLESYDTTFATVRTVRWPMYSSTMYNTTYVMH